MTPRQFCTALGSVVRCVCIGRLSQLIPWESVVSLGHLGSSRGRAVAPVSHQADDRSLRALHAALSLAMIASLHRPYLCFVCSLSDDNKCLLPAILNYIFISLLTSLKQTSIVRRDFKSMWHLLPRCLSLYRWGAKEATTYLLCLHPSYLFTVSS